MNVLATGAFFVAPQTACDIADAYLDFLSDTMTETATWIEKVVHSVSPNTRVALMTGIAEQHAATGKRWEKFLPSLSGEFLPRNKE